MSIHMYIHTSRVFMSRFVVVTENVYVMVHSWRTIYPSCHGRHFYISRWRCLYMSIYIHTSRVATSRYVVVDRECLCHGT